MATQTTETIIAGAHSDDMTKTFSLTLLYTVQVIALFSCVHHTACAQKSLLSDPKEIIIEFTHPATPPPYEVKKHLVALKDIPRSSTLPGVYQLVENKSYLISTKTIDLGDPIIKIKAPVNSEEEFRKVRILRRVENELSESGYEWRDCTLSRDNLPVEDPTVDSPEHRDYIKGYEEYYSKYFPNYSTRAVACLVEGLKAEEYFTVVKQLEPSPKRAFTELKLALLEGTSPNQTDKEVRYRISITNGGPKNIGALAIRTTFDTGTEIASYSPSRGICTKKFGGETPRLICFFGSLQVGDSTTLELRGTPTPGFAEAVPPGQVNIGWLVDAIISERPNDPLWTVNQFRFQPLKSK